MPTRTRKSHRSYQKHLKSIPSSIDCEFCIISLEYPQFIESTEYFKVFQNIFPYSTWDMMRTEDHILVVPNQHTDKLSDLGTDERLDFMEIISRYELDGYNVYARAPKSSVKSVHHQHTHLIKTRGKPQRFMLYAKRPYIRLVG